MTCLLPGEGALVFNNKTKDVKGIVFGRMGVWIVPYAIEVAPDSFSNLGADDGAFDLWFPSMQFLTDKVFAGLMPAYFHVVWRESNKGFVFWCVVSGFTDQLFINGTKFW